ncbi:DUF6541 family protein [Collinsella sp. CM84Y_54]|uniref:DUF6541 family protein n=1 Tax=Collinsella sp. CM84Y_54 TaxID=3085309 RepID=UPI000D78D61B|nr:DUF6541 family protein [Collinsella sp. CM84Y_54]PWM71240.1 MAG: hypothetical protein DBX59_09390 [Bacillota bacterium]
MRVFAISVLIVTFILFAPGSLLLRIGFKKINPQFICLAPALSAFVFLVAGVIGTGLGLTGAAFFILLTFCFVVSLAFPIRLINSRSRLSTDGFSNVSRLTWPAVGICVAVGAILVAALFLSNIDGLSSFIQYDDNLSHLAWIKSIADSGNFSTIRVTYYDSTAFPSAFLGSGSYYPIVWHIPAALLVSLTGIQTSVAENASIFCFIAFAYPLGILAFLDSICKNAKVSPFIVAISAFASVAFPMRMLAVHGPFPNIAAFCLVPAAAALLIRSISFGERFCFYGATFYAFVLALVGVAGVHPNAAIFTCLLIAPFILLRIIPFGIMDQRAEVSSKSSILRTRCAQIIFCFFCVLLWVAVYNLPFMHGIVSFTWEWGMSLEGILQSIVNGSFFFGVPQVLLCPLFAIGAIYVLIHEKEQRWFFLSFAIVLLIYIGAGAFSAEARSFFSGFWYTDPERIAAMVAISLVPFIYFGLHGVVLAAYSVLKHLRYFSGSLGFNLSAVLISLLFFFLNCYPFNYAYAWEDHSRGDLTNAFTLNSYDLYNGYSRYRVQAYTAAERDFIQQVKEVVPEGSLIINLPVDGSSFAWSVDGLNLYYHAKLGSAESEDSHAIRKGLCNISTDSTVKDAVENTGAKYVLLLDRSDYTAEDKHVCYSRDLQYKKKDWEGITEINDETPGFEPVLSSGSMRLYLIK